jgi:hypothetical protein
MAYEPLSKYLISARFEVFFHVPDSEKYRFFRKFIHAPFHDPSFCEVLNEIFQTNQYQLLKKLIKDMYKQERITHFPNKDIDFILYLFWEESDPKLAKKIFLLLKPCPYKLEQIVQNLIFSASCPQDKHTALCILE